MNVQIFAHRGASGRFAEHTRAAYLAAMDDGADGVECDLHLTADGRLVLLHDERVDRTSNGEGPVAELTLEELRRLDFSSWKQPDIPARYGDRADQLLTLDDLLDLLLGAGRPIALAIELKYAGPFSADLPEAILATLRERGWSVESSRLDTVSVTFMSFHPEAVHHLSRTLAPAFLCQLLEEPGGQAAAAGEDLLARGVAHIAGPGVDYLGRRPDRAARWLAAGQTLRVWTVNTEEELRLCTRLGVTEVTTDWPDRIRRFIG